jgi:dGTPase
LAHDLGHPPFGHNGEEALNAVSADIGGFEGNAQTFRIVTRLEARTLDPDGGPAGLNLTRATLDAICKYPWQRQAGRAKFGVYAADRPAFAWVRAGLPADLADGHRCLEAQVMDWADDVAYSVHDVEDGVHSGHVQMAQASDGLRRELCEVAAELYSPLSADDLAVILDDLFALPTLRDLGVYDRSYSAQAAAKRATSELTGRFVGAAVAATRARYGDAPLSRHAADLVIPDVTVAEVALLKAVAAHFVMRRPGADERLRWQRELLTVLVASVADGAPGTLEPMAATAWVSAPDDAARMRVVIDQIAQLTDSAAIAWHARLTGGNQSR